MAQGGELSFLRCQEFQLLEQGATYNFLNICLSTMDWLQQERLMPKGIIYVTLTTNSFASSFSPTLPVCVNLHLSSVFHSDKMLLK